MPGNFTVSQFRQWERALEFTTPGAATEAEITEARIASGLTLQGLSDGILLRISDETKEARMPKIDQLGMIKRDDGTIENIPVDGVRAQVASFPSGDFLILRLYLQTDFQHGRSSEGADQIEQKDCHQFALQRSTAQRLLAHLSEYLEVVDGSAEALH